jgi:hypothetical protein
MGQSPDPKLDPYTALNALKLIKETERMTMAGQAQQPTSSPSILAENMAPPPMMQGLGAMVPGAMDQAPQGMQQAPQGMPPQDMQQAPMQQPPMQAASGGLAGMYTPEEDYAAGGIVAFQVGGGVTDNEQAVLDAIEEDNRLSYGRELEPGWNGGVASPADVSRAQQVSSNIDEDRTMIKGLTRGTTTPEEDDAAINRYLKQIDRYGGPNIYDPANKQLTERTAARAKTTSQGQGLAMLAAAGALLEGNTLARGAAKAFPVFAKEMGEVQRADIAEQRSIEGMQFALADAQRKERMGDIRGAIAARESARKEKNDAAEFELKKAQALATLDAKTLRELKATGQGKPTDLMNYVNDYVADAQKRGDTRPPETIKVEGYQKYPGYVVKQQAIASTASTAQGAQNLTKEGQTLTAQSTGIKEFNDLPLRDPAKKQFTAAARIDKANAEKGITSDFAGKVRRDWIQRNTPGAQPPSNTVRPPPPPGFQ